MVYRTCLLFIALLLMPSGLYADTLFRLDMDPLKEGLQTTVQVERGDIFTTNLEVVLNDVDTLKAFGVSLWWDMEHTLIPVEEMIQTFALGTDWIDLSYNRIESPYLYNFSQVNFDYSQGPSTETIATIAWMIPRSVENGSVHIMPGYFDTMLDGSYDMHYNQTITHFQSGTVVITPEPLSSILFLSGGAVLAGRMLLQRRRAAKV